MLQPTGFLGRSPPGGPESQVTTGPGYTAVSRRVQHLEKDSGLIGAEDEEPRYCGEKKPQWTDVPG